METIGDILAEMDAERAPDSDDAFRARNIGASEVSALFDANPWLTEYELFHQKAGTIAKPDFSGNARIEAGQRLEPVIVDWARDKWGYDAMVYPAQRLANGCGLAGHPDAVACCPERNGAGILEVKTADWLVAKKWGDEPPLHYLLQLTTYMGLSGATWGDVIVLVGGNELKRWRYEFRPKLYAEIEKRVEAFWERVRGHNAPAPDFNKDAEAIGQLYADATDEVVDLTDSGRAGILAAQFLFAKADRDKAEAVMEASKAELLTLIGDAGRAKLDGFSITANRTKDTPDRIATVGEIIKGRRGYRRFDVKERND
jgi:predicted phage-related endonuclease